MQAAPDGAGFGAAAARACLLAWGADTKQATAAWVANHFRWVVWKLAAYDRKLLGSCGAQCLTVDNVMDQLQRRCAFWVRSARVKHVVPAASQSSQNVVLLAFVGNSNLHTAGETSPPTRPAPRALAHGVAHF